LLSVRSATAGTRRYHIGVLPALLVAMVVAAIAASRRYRSSSESPAFDNHRPPTSLPGHAIGDLILVLRKRKLPIHTDEPD
jgi:hypothetical protein